MADLIKKVDGLEMIIFDLDYTLWPFWIDTHVTPPFTKSSDGKVYDSHRQLIKYYPEVPAILEKLKSLGYKIGIASRTSETIGANDLLNKLGWDKFIDFKEIYPGRKTEHMNKLSKSSGLNFQKFLFFDDEQRNIIDCSQINVCSFLVESGMNFRVLKQGMEKFEKSKQ